MSKEATVNGLYATPKTCSRVNRNVVAKKRDDDAVAINLLEEETKMKDKLLSVVSDRCSKAEARVEEILMDKARVERELASMRYVCREEGLLKMQLEQTMEEHAVKENLILTSLESEKKKFKTVEDQLLRLSQKHADQKQSADIEISNLKNELNVSSELNFELRSKVEQLENGLMQVHESFRIQESDFLNSKAKEKDIRIGYTEMEQEARELAGTVNHLIQDSERLRQINFTALEKADHLGILNEALRKKYEMQCEKNRNLENQLKHQAATSAESDGKIHRLSSQIKNTSKKAAFLVDKADTWQQKYVEKDKELDLVKHSMKDLEKKCNLLRERLEYEKHSHNNNQKEVGTSFLPKRKSSLLPPKSRIQNKVISNRLVDPAMDAESDAPEWLRF